MPNAKELQRMLNDFQQLVPQVVGAIVAVIAAIGVLAAALPEDTKEKISSDRNSGPTTTITATPNPPSQPKHPTPPTNKPTTAKLAPTSAAPHQSEVYLSDLRITDSSAIKANDQIVKAGGTEYQKSIMANGDRSWVKFGDLEKKYSKLEAKVAFDTDVKNDFATVGMVTISIDGSEVERIIIKPGEIKDLSVDVRNLEHELVISFYTDNSERDHEFSQWNPANGLAVLSPVLTLR